jgi:hypothetical protein
MNRGAVICSGVFCVLFLAAVAILSGPGFHEVDSDWTRSSEVTGQKPGAPAMSLRIDAGFGDLPLHFEPNQGQLPPEFDFASRGQGYSIYLASTRALIVARGSAPPGSGSSPEGPGAAALENSPENLSPAQAASPLAMVQMNLVGANPDAVSAGLDPLPGRSNYFIGNDRDQWRTNIPHFSRTVHREVYPGIDLVFYGSQGELEFDFVVAPGADPSLARLQFEGQDSLSLDADGRLILGFDGGELHLLAPRVFQDLRGERRRVEGAYRLEGDDLVAFELGEWDSHEALVIDPVLTYSTYLGGSGTDFATDIAVDSEGNAYIAGSTESPNFPVMGQIQGATGIPKAFITKLSADGRSLVYSTYLGGPSIFDSDIAFGIAVDRLGRAYVTGRTESASFPTVNAFDGTLGGDQDAFLAQLNQAGNALLFSTYLGGSEDDLGSDVVVDNIGSSYVSGWTRSSDMPTVSPYQGANGGGLG